MTAVLEISGLQKTYRSRKGLRRALDGFDMVVEGRPDLPLTGPGARRDAAQTQTGN